MIVVKNVLLDTSFIIQLMNSKSEYHNNARLYFEYFANYKIEMYISTISISEYAIISHPDYLKYLKTFKIIDFNYMDALISGQYANLLKGKKKLSKNGRSIVINDIKLLAQLNNRKIEGIVTNEQNMKSKIIDPLRKNHQLQCMFIDFTRPLNEFLGTLF